jgi:hypothetical protein
MAKAIKEPKLTLKQTKFLKYYFETGNATQAVLKAGYNCDEYTARAIGSQNLTKLNVKVKDLMEAKGLSLGRLMDTLDDGLQSWKVHTSHTEPDRKVPDFATRHKYLETAAKWLGIETAPENQTNIQINFTRDEN